MYLVGAGKRGVGYIAVGTVGMAERQRMTYLVNDDGLMKLI